MNLGTLITIYRDRPLLWRDLITMFIPASLAVFAPLLYGYQRAVYAREHYGPVAAQAWSRPWYLLSAFALIPFLLLGLQRLRRTHREVRIYKNGLSMQGLTGMKQFTWGEIAGIKNQATLVHFLGIPIQKKVQVSLHPSIGKPSKIDPHIPNLDELCARIKAKIYPRLIAEMRASLQAGSRLYFGPLQMDLERISINNQSYRWDQVSDIQVHQGTLTIELGDHSVRKIPTGRILNVDIFVQLVQEGIKV